MNKKVYLISYSVFNMYTSCKFSSVINTTLDAYKAKDLHEIAVKTIIKEYGLKDLSHKTYSDDGTIVSSVTGKSDLSRSDVEITLSQHILV